MCGECIRRIITWKPYVIYNFTGVAMFLVSYRVPRCSEKRRPLPFSFPQPTRMEKGSAAGGSSRPPPMPSLEDFPFEGKKPVKNPFVPIGALVTAGVLTAGLVSFRYGNSRLGQKLMRARVVAQGVTVALMVGSAYYYGDQIKLFKKGSSP